MPAKSSAWDAQIHHAAATPPLAALSLYAAGAAVSYVHRPLAVIGVTVVAAMAGALAVAVTRPHMWVLVHRAAAIGFAALWIVLTQLTSPFRAPSIIALIAAAALLWAFFPLVSRADLRERDAALRAAKSLMTGGGVRGDWPGMLARLGLPRIQVEDTVTNPAGYTKVLRLPPDGSITFRRVRGIAEQLEVALDLEPGWVRFERGQRARVLVHVTTRDVLAETVALPRCTEPRSINDPIDIGISETGEVLLLTLREIAVLVVGVRGAGKSNLINVLIDRLGNCVDAVIWGIDFKNGRTLRPWLQPWLDGKTERPVIDWVATDRDEAALMMDAALTAIDVRSASGVGGEKITPRAEQPAIILLCEEVSSLTGLHAPGSRASTNLLTSITQTGRSEAVDPILVTQRGTVTMVGSGDLKSQIRLRIALGGGSEEDARALLGDSQLARIVAALRHKGSLCVQHDDARPIPAKGFRVDPEEVYGLAEACSWLRPGLEADLEAALGADYADRWSVERAGHLLTGKPKPKPVADESAKPAAAKAATAPTSSGPAPVPPPPRVTPAWKTTDGTPIPRGTEHYTEPDVDDVFTALTKGLDVDTSRPHAGRARLVGLLEQVGAGGRSPDELTRLLNENGIGCVRQTVQGWLKDLVDSGEAVKQGSGVNVRYIHRMYS